MALTSTMRMEVCGKKIMGTDTVVISGRDGRTRKIGREGEIERAFGQMVEFVEVDVMSSNFEELLTQVYSFWPKILGTGGGLGIVSVDIKSIEHLYESQIAPFAQASESRLIIQLDWIVYGVVCSIMKMTNVVRLEEINKEYLKERFHKLLLTIGVSQLKREIEADGSFDLPELAAYLERNGLYSSESS